MIDKIKKMLKNGKIREIIAYLIIGFLTTMLNLLVYYVCTNYFLNPEKIINVEIANVIAWVVAVIFAYVTNRVIVFRSKDHKVLKESIKFFLGRIFTLLLELVLMALMLSVMHIDDKIAKIICQIIIIVGNYIISKLFVFKKKDCDINSKINEKEK